MKKIIALLLCFALCATMLCACKQTDPKDLLPMHTFTGEENPDEWPKISGEWELNENITCMEFTENIQISYDIRFTKSILMRFIEDEKNPRYEFVLIAPGDREMLLCTVTKDGTQWKDGVSRVLRFHDLGQSVSAKFNSWFLANAKPITD